MLATDEKRLRWWGIDMGPRWRRRVAVVATYFVLFVLVAVATDNHWAAHNYLALAAMVLLTVIWQSLSIFRKDGVVKSFEDPPLTKSGIRGMVFVNGLDEWAQYKFGVASFEDANEQQKAELLRRYRVGTYAFPAKPKPWTGLDEREVGERDDASRWALRRIAWLLAFYAGTFAVKPKPIAPVAVAGFLWSFFLLAVTLPQARVLWTEPDAREVGGEMEMVEREV
jgi:hypothetical protein